MRQEQRYERREDEDARNRRWDGDITRGELVNMDGFMDSHPEIAEQLQKDPSLIKNKEFVENHPALEQFLKTHPGVREEFTENPNAFMPEKNGSTGTRMTGIVIDGSAIVTTETLWEIAT
jgi:hypothetical protein